MLSVEELSFTYPGMPEQALTEVSFSVPAGSVLGILGPVGAGRTTLCMCLAGLVPRITGGRSTGDLWLGEIDPRTAASGEMARLVGVVLQDQSAQITQVTVLDEITAPMVNRGVAVADAETRAWQLLDHVGLGASIGGVDSRIKRTWELSGGQQQRVTIAAMLAGDPEVVVLDNATVALDAAGREQTRAMIADLAGDKTVLVVEQADFLMEVADLVLVLDGGRVRGFGPIDEVLRDLELLADVGVEPPLPARVGRAIGLAELPLTVGEFERTFATRVRVTTPAAAGGGDAREPDSAPPPDVDVAREPDPGGVAVRVQDVTYRYPDGTAAVEAVSLEVAAGQVHAIIGGNGAGKTTMVKLLVGLLRPSSGTVHIAGSDTSTTVVADLAARVGTALQNPDEQITERTVAEEVAFPLQRRRHERTGWFSRRERYDDDEIRERVQRACSRVGLGDLLGADPSLLAHGRRKLVTIAEALVLDPAVLVLDEPAAGLDVGARRHLARVLTELRQRGTAIVLIEHDMDLVAELANSVTVMEHGEVVLQDSPRAVFATGNWERLASMSVEPPRAARLADRIGQDALTYAELVAALLDESEVR